MATPLKVIVPIAITDTVLYSSTVPESETAWVSGGTYVVGDRRRYNHSIYECSLNHTGITTTPDVDPNRWIYVSPTNRWKALDSSSSTKTAQATSISYTFRAGRAVTAVGVLNVVGGTSIRIRVVDPVYGTAYDVTTSISPITKKSTWWDWYFGPRSQTNRHIALDLPSLPNADIIIDVAGSSDLAIGVITIGTIVVIGDSVRYGAGTGITDYSVKEENQWGDVVLSRGNYAEKINLDLVVKTDDVDDVRDALTELRATPCVWVASPKFRSLVVFGYFYDFSIVIDGPFISECEIEIRGLS